MLAWMDCKMYPCRLYMRYVWSDWYLQQVQAVHASIHERCVRSEVLGWQSRAEREVLCNNMKCGCKLWSMLNTH